MNVLSLQVRSCVGFRDKVCFQGCSFWWHECPLLARMSSNTQPPTPTHLVRKTLISTRRLIKSVDESVSAVLSFESLRDNWNLR